MTFDALRFLKDNNISHSTEHQHSTAGWVQVQVCPFCKSQNFHLGIHQIEGGVNCWKCGVHSLREIIKALLNCTWGTVNRIITIYAKENVQRYETPRQIESVLKPCGWPIGTIDLQPRHKWYLTFRRFDPDQLKQEWGLRGTSAMGNYKFRVIAPITYQGIMVSYTGRDVTDKSNLRYKSCTKSFETRPHKHCLYGLDKLQNKSVIVVEGITSVWRLGAGNAVATFGIAWTVAQARLLLGMERVFILFDMGEDAQRQANKLAQLLAGSVKCVEVVDMQLDTGKDPADLSDDEAKVLVKELLRK